MPNVSQSPNFHLSKTPPKLSNNKQVFLKNNKPNKRSGKSKHKNNNNNDTRFSNNININNNNRPMKVVHISNPMRYNATAAEFRALVQGLTGRDAVVEDDTHFFATHHHEADAVEGHDDHHDHTHHNNGANSSTTDNNSDDNTSDDNNKVMLLHDNHHQQDYHYYYQQEHSLSGCFGPSDDQLSFDYYGAFNNGDFVVMEDHLRALMGDDGHQ